MLNIYAEYDAGANTIEIIDISDPSKSCLLSDLQEGGMMRAASGLLGSSPIICGGWDGSERDDCIVLDSPAALTITMNQKRHGPSSVSINSTTLWVVGGGVGQIGVNLGGSNGTLFESTEFISLNGGASYGPDIPVPIYLGCMVQNPENDNVLVELFNEHKI